MPFMGYQTYYRIVGTTEEGKSPIILLHGGPGSTHNYFELLDRVAETGRAFIMYDQLGCGKSFVEGHPELWTPETWLNELCALIDHLHLEHFHLLGQSWGGMLTIIYLMEIQVPCLVMSGTDDLCTPLVAKTLYDGIPDSKWHLFVGARHMPFAEQNDEYCQVLEEWLAEKD